MKKGNLPEAAQSNLPESTMTPPIEVPCPPIHLVADSTTTSAPCSMGWTRNPHMPKVLSTMSGMPCSCASAESPARSATFPPGLPIDSV